jgi:hypothetical protein
MRSWAELLIGPVKKYGWEYKMGKKDRWRNTGGPKQKRKKEIKTETDFWAAENWKFDSNGFLFKNSSKPMQVESCFVHLVT